MLLSSQNSSLLFLQAVSIVVFFLTRPFQNLPSTLFLNQAVLLMLLVPVKQMSAWVPVIFFLVSVVGLRLRFLCLYRVLLRCRELILLFLQAVNILVFFSTPDSYNLPFNIMWFLLFGVIIVFVGNRVKSRLKTKPHG